MPKEKVYFMGLLANVDSSIMNLKLEHGFTIKPMKINEIAEILAKLDGLPSSKIMREVSIHCRCVVNNTVYVIMKELNCDGTKNKTKSVEMDPRVIGINQLVSLDAKYLTPNITLMRLYKEGGICLSKKYFYSIHDGIPGPRSVEGPIPNIEHNKYSLENSEINGLMDFIQYTSIPFKKEYINLTFQNYELSYSIPRRDIKFLILMIGLEALFNQHDSEISKTISRNCAILIGDDFKNTERIYKQMRQLYKIRSKIVHSGKSNVAKEEDVIELRDYLRKAIKEAYTIDKDKEKLNEMLNTCGFGERPWRNNV